MHVYVITNLIDNKKYVGAEKGNDPEYHGHGSLIIKDEEELGKEDFKKEILIDDRDIGSWDECLALESICILSLNTLIPNGYNIKLFAWPPTIEACRKGGKSRRPSLDEILKEIEGKRE